MAGTWRAAAHCAVVFLGVGAAFFAQLARAEEPTTQAYRDGRAIQMPRTAWFFTSSMDSATPLPAGSVVTIVGDGPTRNGQHFVTVRKSNGQTGEVWDHYLEGALPSASAQLAQRPQPSSPPREPPAQEEAEEPGTAQVFICPNPPSAYPVILTIDSSRRAAMLEITTDTTATHCVQVFRDGAYASVWQG
jgi:hypothetical protein